jgi:hypothetical protein
MRGFPLGLLAEAPALELAPALERAPVPERAPGLELAVPQPLTVVDASSTSVGHTTHQPDRIELTVLSARSPTVLRG